MRRLGHVALGPVTRWAGLVVALCLVIAMVGSAGVEVNWRWRDADGVPRGVNLRHGRIWIWRDPMLATPRLGVSVERIDLGLEWHLEDWQLQFGTSRSRLVAIPLWWGVAGAGVPVAVAWGVRWLPARRRGMRRARGMCWRCGYEVGGLGVCPECGASVG